MTNGMILLLMTALFLIFGYMGVPVAFALMAGVLVACALTPISMQSMIGQMFHGIDSEILLAVPFFLLVGELMTSADVTNRMIRLAQTMVGHMRGGLAQVVTLFSMFFAGISGSSTALLKTNVVTLIFASWNQMREWLRRVEALRQAA